MDCHIIMRDRPKHCSIHLYCSWLSDIVSHDWRSCTAKLIHTLSLCCLVLMTSNIPYRVLTGEGSEKMLTL